MSKASGRHATVHKHGTPEAHKGKPETGTNANRLRAREVPAMTTKKLLDIIANPCHETPKLCEKKT